MEPPPKRQKTTPTSESSLARRQRSENPPPSEQRSVPTSPPSDRPVETAESNPSLLVEESHLPEVSRGPDYDNLLQPDYDNLLRPEFFERPRIEIDPVSFVMSRQPSSSRGRASQSTSAGTGASATASTSRHSTDPDRHSQSQSQSESQSQSQPPYQLVTSGPTRNPRHMSQVSETFISPGFIYSNKDALLASLRSHKVNTITELRRIEKILAHLDSPDVTEPMTSAWTHYVDSHNLLTELRGLTPQYPFSSACLDEAKNLVQQDPGSARSWNYAWLVLRKIQKEGLIAKHARLLASKPAMWGDQEPTPEGIEKLTKACVASWERAVAQMLKHWEDAPSLTGS